MRDIDHLRNGANSLKSGFPNFGQDGGSNVIEQWSSGAILGIRIFPSSAYLVHTELNDPQSTTFVSEMERQFFWNLVSVKASLG
jgi:hypothetical protein